MISSLRLAGSIDSRTVSSGCIPVDPTPYSHLSRATSERERNPRKVLVSVIGREVPDIGPLCILAPMDSTFLHVCADDPDQSTPSNCKPGDPWTADSR